MTLSKFALISLCIVIAVSVLFGLADSQAEGPAATNLSALSKSASEALKAAIANQETGRGSIEDIYTWSKRTMEAEQADGIKGAAARHHERMVNVKTRVDAIYAVGGPGGDAVSVAAANYYTLESAGKLD